MKLLFILALFPLSSCGAPPVLLRPVDAGAFEGRFSYWKNNRWIESRGEDGDYFKTGDAFKIDVKTHEEAGRCQVKVTDGDFDEVRDCTRRSHVEFDLGKIAAPAGTNKQVNYVVSSEKLGSFQGSFHIMVLESRPPLPISNLACPRLSGKQNLIFCSRPAGFTVSLSPKFPEAGRALYTLGCNSGKSETREFDVQPGETRIDIATQGKDFCFVTFAFKSASQRLSTLLFLRLYDQAYIPLARPEKEGTQYCLNSKDYKAFTLDGEDREKNWFSPRCMDVQKELMVWDAIGRFISVRK